MKEEAVKKILISKDEEVLMTWSLTKKKLFSSLKKYVILSSSRLYFYGTLKPSLLSRAKGLKFINIDSVIAGAKSKMRSILSLIIGILLLIGGLVLFYQDYALASESDYNPPYEYLYVSGGLFLIALIIFLKNQKKTVTVEYLGGNLIIPCNKVSDKDINKFLEHIANITDNKRK